MDDLLYKLALMRIPNVGAVTARSLLAYCGSPEAVFSARPKELKHIPGVGEITARQIHSKEALRLAEQEIPYLEQHEIRVLFFQDADFPERLRRLDQGPVLLYYRGTADLNHLRTVGIIGTRKPSVWGTAMAERLVEQLGPYQPLIISGLAYGIDICAHRAALQQGLPTLGVLGHGLNRIYPAVHRRTARDMIEQGGLLTEYPFFTEPEREHFPMRNRIVAGLCDAVVVVESPEKGGSIITAQFANDYNRDVFAVPGRVQDAVSAGCNWLIKTHRAALLENAEDIAHLLRWEAEGHSPEQQLRLFNDLGPEEKIIVDLLREQEALHIDRLMIDSKLPSGLVVATLLELECRGIVRVLPGKRYVLIK